MGVRAVTGDETTDAARSALIDACRHLAAAGLSPGSSGNVSVRVGDSMLITPTGSALSRVREEDLAEIGIDDAVREAAAPAPSKEAPLHRAAYRNRPGTGAVVHLHSPYATAVSCLPAGDNGVADLPALTPYRVMRLGEVPLLSYAPPGTAGLADGVAAVVREHPAMLLANHGSVVAASSLAAATDLAEELETAAQLTLLLHGTPALPLTLDQVASLTSGNRDSSGKRS
jgi:ribulose-5-phosphate 4-epimerase/fuculose-1-phosphate aldolase